ncbi:MAG: hypothetical protein K0U37_00400 [Gammaproteobacteria bacterium]|nr:hypothetical protein [Gammaproteobacteria bacterium]
MKPPKALVKDAEKALISLKNVLLEPGETKRYRQVFNEVGEACQCVASIIDLSHIYMPDHIEKTLPNLTANLKSNLDFIEETLRETPYKMWGECKTMSDMATYALFAVEKLVRALFHFLTAGYVKTGRQNQFFQGADEPKAVMVAVSELNILSEKLGQHLEQQARDDKLVTPSL